MKYDAGTRLMLMAPISLDVNQTYEKLWEEVRAMGFQRIRIDNQTLSIDEAPELNRRNRHLIEVVVDRIVVKPESRSRIADSLEAALAVGKGICNVAEPMEKVPEKHWKVVKHSQLSLIHISEPTRPY